MRKLYPGQDCEDLVNSLSNNARILSYEFSIEQKTRLKHEIYRILNECKIEQIDNSKEEA